MARIRWLVGSSLVVILAACSGGGGGGGGGETSHTLTVTVAGTGAGTVTSSPSGISCSSGTCTATFAHGTAVTLTATPSGSTFAGWGGACTGGGTCSLTLNGDMSLTATFDAPKANLSVTVAGSGSGTVNSPVGINCASGGGVCSLDLTVGTQVTLTATPVTEGSTFAGWGGACASAGTGACTLTLNADASATATFVPTVMRTLTVGFAGSGSGSVTSTPSGISCASDGGGTCSAPFPEGKAVTLTATPKDEYSAFGSWSGACTAEPCTVTMSADASATATFTAVPVKRTVTVSVTGGGTVTSTPAGISCPGTCSFAFDRGGPPPAPFNTVALTPQANAGWLFSGWSGACSGSAGCNVTLDVDKTVAATFTQDPGQTLTVTLAGDGHGTVTSEPAGITCTTTTHPTVCTANFPTGSTVTLTGTAAADSSFYGWSPTCDASPGPCSFQIGSTTSLTATFPAWVVRRPFPNTIKGIAALGSTLVAVGTGGRVVTSADGLAWTGHELANTRNQLRAVAADATTAVAVGDAGTILTSGDGVAWTSRTSGTTGVLTSVAYGGSRFVAVGYAGVVLYSTDGGATWNSGTSGTAYDLLSVAYGSGRFVAVGYGGTVLGSLDGQSWTQAAAGLTTTPVTGVAYDASSGFVAVGNVGAVLTSTNGIDWTKQAASIPVSGQTTVVGVAARAATFVALDSAHDTIVSADGGASWTSHAVADDLNDGAATAIGAAGSNFFSMAEGGISLSADGAAWSRVLTLRGVFYSMAYGNSAYVLVGHGVIFTSPDGLEWTSRYAGNPYARSSDIVSSVVFGNGRFIAVSGHGILSSTDGASWTQVSAAPSQYGGVVEYGASQGFVVAAQSNTASDIWTSPDGATWTKQAGTSITAPLGGIAWGASTFVAVGGWNDTAIYTNGSPASTPAWTKQNAATTNGLGSVLYGNSTFVASDGQYTMFTSPNGIAWTAHSTSLMRLLAFGNGTFLTQNLQTSTDGATWTPMAFPPPGMSYVYAGTRGPDRWVLATGTGGVGNDAGTYVFGVHL